jgi:hypothetical protein
MAYSDLANNQGVSFNSLISGVSQGYFDAKTTIPSSSQMTTKSACNTYVTVDPNYPPFASKSDNQLVVKQDLRNNEATLYITNNFFTGTITNVTVNGVSVTGGSFPLDIGNSTTAYSNQIGTYDILVYYADATNPSNYMEIQDSEYNSSCVDGFTSFGPSPYVTFSSQILNTSVAVTIVSGDGSCPGPIPLPPISTLPFATVAVSRGTGQYMLAGNANFTNGYSEGLLFRSTNYGVTWQPVSAFGYWYKVAISDNGQYMLAVEYYGRAYRSSDYGANWTAINNFPFPTTQPCPETPFPALQTLNFRGAALSGDGQYQVICTAATTYGTCSGGYTYMYNTIFVSNDYGATWTARENDQGSIYNAVAISSSGQTVLAATGTLFVVQGSILRSNNYGVNWGDTVNSLNTGQLVDVAITEDGLNAIGARFSNDYFPFLIRSVDGGVTWNTITGWTGNYFVTQQTWMRACINNYQNLDVRAWAIPNSRNFSPPGPYYMFNITSGISTVTEYTSGTGLGEKYFKSLANSNNGQYLLVGANNGLFVSNDYGSTYTAI